VNKLALGQRGRRVGGACLFLLVLAIGSCQERLTSPADCPALCPGGEQAVLDTSLLALPGLDSSFTGYVARGAGRALLVSNGLPASEDRAVYTFASRSDSISVRDTLRAYAIDSVQLSFSLVARDTLVSGLKVFVFRLPPTLDSTATFADVTTRFLPETLIDSILVPDSVHSGVIQTTLRGTDLDRVAIPLGTGGVLAVGLGITANSPTGIRLGSTGGSNGATFVTFATVDVPDTTTTIKHQSFSRSTSFNTFVTQSPLVPDPNLLTVGGEPSSRALVRFGLPPVIKDTATLVRATIELTPVTPIQGLPTDVAVVVARAVLADLGAKSPVSTLASDTVADTLLVPQVDTVRIDVTRVVQAWQGSSPRPSAIFLSLDPEAASFSRAVFYSTRAADPTLHPRLRVTYVRPFPFENP
jgi:hypothetical protein